MNDIDRLVYTELVIKEVLRLYHSAPAYGRNVGVDLDIGELVVFQSSGWPTNFFLFVVQVEI